MVITVTPDIEQALNELAERQGTTGELLALKPLRERLFPSKPHAVALQSIRRHAPQTLADFLAGYIGVIDSSECVKESGQLSKNTGKMFADILLEKRRQGRL